MLIIHGEEVVQTKLRCTIQTARDCVKSTGISSCCCYTIVLNAMQYFSLQTRLRQLGDTDKLAVDSAGHTAPCWPWSAPAGFCGKMPNSWNDTDDFRKHLKHGDFMIDNRCCTKCISNKCRQRGGQGSEKMSAVLSSGRKKLIVSNIWL